MKRLEVSSRLICYQMSELELSSFRPSVGYIESYDELTNCPNFRLNDIINLKGATLINGTIPLTYSISSYISLLPSCHLYVRSTYSDQPRLVWLCSSAVQHDATRGLPRFLILQVE